MKKIGLVYFTPLIISISLLCLNGRSINASLFSPINNNIPVDSAFRYIPNFSNNAFYENQFLASNNGFETIFILGSSELTSASEAIPYNFISGHFKTQLKGIGHQGNQCFSIYTQLLANENRLYNAPIVIIISPGWFHSESANGTSSSLFLEFNSPRFLNNIIKNDSCPLFKSYTASRIADFYDEISSPDLSIKLLYFEGQAAKSILHKCLYNPLIETDRLLNKLKYTLTNSSYNESSKNKINRPVIIPDPLNINWDSLYIISKQRQKSKSGNNNWYIEDTYYTEYIKGKTSSIKIVKENSNKELEDFKMLISLLKCKKTNASFIILPLNPYYYTNLNDLSPLINTLNAEIADKKFPCLNLWNADSTTFDNGILSDVMHLSDYGWYKADKFITATYKLSK